MDVVVGMGGVAAIAALVAVGTAVGARRTARGRAVAGGAALVALLVGAAVVVFALVISDETLAAADVPVLGWILAHRGPALTTTARVLSTVGGTAGTGAVGVVCGVVLFLRGRRWWGVVWVLGVGVGALTIRLVKLAVERPRPPVADRLGVETTTSLPSGHALMAALGLGLLAAAVVALGRGPVRVAVPALVVALVVAVGAGRAYLGVHWTTDVVAGWLLGTALAVVCRTVAVAVDPPHRDRPDVGPNEGHDARATVT